MFLYQIYVQVIAGSMMGKLETDQNVTVCKEKKTNLIAGLLLLPKNEAFSVDQPVCSKYDTKVTIQVVGR